MKNVKRTLMLTAILFGAFSLSACGGVERSNSSAESSGEAETSVTSQASESSESSGITEAGKNEQAKVTEAQKNDSKDNSESQPEPSEKLNSESVPDSEPENPTESSQDYMETANELIFALNEIDLMGGSNIGFDESKTFTDENGYTYAQTEYFHFTSTAQLRQYLEENLTESFLNDRYSGILGTDTPRYIDHDGMVYVRTDIRSGGFSRTDTPIKIENITDSSFTILAEYDNFGAAETMGIDVVKDHGSWKINNVAFGL